ncbi:MAG: AsmA family protein [Pseudomonadota bacterium]
MKKWLLISLTSIAALIVTLILLIANLDLNAHKTEITEAISAITGWQIELGGEIDVKPGLIPSLHVAGVEVKNPSWPSDSPLLTSENITINLALLALIKGKVEFRKINIDSLTIALATNPDGLNNWQFGENLGTASSALELPWLDVTALKINQALISYKAANQDKQTLAIRKLNCTLVFDLVDKLSSRMASVCLSWFAAL